jgi:ribosome-associated protein
MLLLYLVGFKLLSNMHRISRSSVSYQLDLEKLGKVAVDQESLKDAVLSALQTLRAQDIQVFEGHTLAKYSIIADHETAQAVYSSASNIGFMLKQSSSYRPSFCGYRGSEWIIVDAQDVIVDLFTKEARQRYNLEELLHQKSSRIL